MVMPRGIGSGPDVFVAGGGPAGCAAALSLLRVGRSVLLLEGDTKSGHRTGEILPPRARPVLEGLGLLERFQVQQHMPAPAMRCRWGTDLTHEVDLTFHPYGSGWHLDRRAFDSMLLDAVRAHGGRVLRGASVRGLGWQSGCWQVQSTGPGSPSSVCAPVVIDATGRTRSVSRRLGARRLLVDSLVGLVGIGETAFVPSAVQVVTLIEADEAGWWYAGRLPGGRVVAALMTDADLIPRGYERLRTFWRARLGRTVLVSRQWGLVAGPASLRVVAAGTGRLAELAGPGWLAIGDAAMTFDPLSGQGICAALESGARSGLVADRMLSGEAQAHREHSSTAEATFRDHLHGRTHYYRQEKRFNTAFWLRRQQRCPLGQ